MIIVCPLAAVQPLIDAHGVKRVVSLLGPDTPHAGFARIAAEHHLKLTFHDVVSPQPGFISPRPQDAEKLIAFLDGWDKAEPLLIHCWAGISRSTAAAYTALCRFHPQADEEELAWRLRAASPSATPNRLIVSHADQLMGRNGRMLKAIDSIGRGEDAYEGTPFTLPLTVPR